ncbi:MAG TPA: SpoIVB peptidase [Clostridiales bacterium]|nr:SpoIVB peptidase [Clostridiales bacterium]
MERKKYRKLLIFILTLNVLTLTVFFMYSVNKQIPDDMIFLVNKEEKFNFNLPMKANVEVEDIDVINVNNKKLPSNKINIDLNKPFTFASVKTGKAKISLKLFGVFNLKNIYVNIIDEIEIKPVGETIGIYIETDGVLVLGSGKITGDDGLNYEPATNKIKSGDYILGINNQKIYNKYDLINEINNSDGDLLKIELKRNDNIENIEIMPIKTVDGSYKIGVWVRDNTQGIGTLTFVTENGEFGALGHGITDIDTGILLDVKQGDIYESEIVSIVKGINGEPGELVGLIKNAEGFKLGSVTQNTGQGIYGNFNENNPVIKDITPLKIGLKQDVKKGKAYIRCNIKDEITDYEVNIDNVDINGNKKNKGIVLSITDKRLLEMTGGIVQGMSGSPIIQNNKVIGAVTHVFVKDSTKGYGTFIEYMISNIE